MKKTKYLALVLVVAIMMMGAGYAAWTETLVIDSTIKTGKFDVQFTEVKVHNDEDGIFKTNIWRENNNDKVVLNINKLYPGASVKSNIKLKNVGDIPALLESLDIEEKGNGYVRQYMDIHVQVAGQDPISFNDAKIWIDQNLDHALLNVDQEFAFDLIFKLQDDAPDKITEEKTVEYIITTNFKQFNQ